MWHIGKRFILMIFLLTNCCLAQARDTVTVMLDWLPNPDQAPLFVGVEQGIFAKHGLDVQLLNPSDAGDPAKMVALGKVDVALTYQPSWLIQRAQGLPVVWIATLIDQPLACLIADTSQGIQSISDLRHKTIGYSSGTVDSLMLTAMLRHAGMAVNDVTRLNVHYNLSQALLSHRVAAISGAMRNVELLELQQQGLPVIAFYPEDHGVPPYAELIFIARQDQGRSPKIQAFVSALSEAMAYVKAKPDEAWPLVIKHHPELDSPINHQIYQATLEFWAKRPSVFDAAQNARLAEFLQAKPD